MCRLVLLDKRQVIRHVRVMDVCHCVIGKAVLRIVRLDVFEVMAGHKFCAKLVSGCEVAVHCMSRIFDDSEAALLVDTTNDFNTLSIVRLLF